MDGDITWDTSTNPLALTFSGDGNLNGDHTGWQGLTVNTIYISGQISLPENSAELFSKLPNLQFIRYENGGKLITTNVKDFSNMFANLPIKKLDLSNFDMSNATNVTGMLSGMADLSYIILGPNTKIANTGLQNYSQKWRAMAGSNDINYLKGDKLYTSAELMSDYNSSMADSYFLFTSQARIEGNSTSIPQGSTYDPKSNLTSVTNSYNQSVDIDEAWSAGKISVSGADFDTMEVGDHQVTYTYTDDAGETHTLTITVTVIPAPSKIDVTDSTIVAGPKQSWTAKDNILDVIDADGQQGDISKVSYDASQVKTNEPGTYPVTYSYTDKLGNVVTATAVITVVKSQISLNVNTDPTYTAGPNALWNAAGEVISATNEYGYYVYSPDVKVDGTVNMNVAGDYPITYTYTDGVGNTVSAQTIVHVKKSPISLTVKDTEIVANSNWYPSDNFVSGVDGYGNPITNYSSNVISTDPSVIDTSKVGTTYTITYKLSDVFGNQTTAEAHVKIVPTKSEITLKENSGTFYMGQDYQTFLKENVKSVLDANGTALDMNDIVVDSRYSADASNADVKYDDAEVDYQHPGTYPVTYTFTDKYGNKVTASCNIVIKAGKGVVVHYVDENGQPIPGVPDGLIPGDQIVIGDEIWPEYIVIDGYQPMYYEDDPRFEYGDYTEEMAENGYEINQLYHKFYFDVTTDYPDKADKTERLDKDIVNPLSGDDSDYGIDMNKSTLLVNGQLMTLHEVLQGLPDYIFTGKKLDQLKSTMGSYMDIFSNPEMDYSGPYEIKWVYVKSTLEVSDDMTVLADQYNDTNKPSADAYIKKIMDASGNPVDPSDASVVVDDSAVKWDVPGTYQVQVSYTDAVTGQKLTGTVNVTVVARETIMVHYVDQNGNEISTAQPLEYGTDGNNVGKTYDGRFNKKDITGYQFTGNADEQKGYPLTGTLTYEQVTKGGDIYLIYHTIDLATVVNYSNGQTTTINDKFENPVTLSENGKYGFDLANSTFTANGQVMGNLRDVLAGYGYTFSSDKLITPDDLAKLETAIEDFQSKVTDPALGYSGPYEVHYQLFDNQATITAHDSTLVAGPNTKWTAADNFDEITDIDGNKLGFDAVTKVEGSVDTTKAGSYTVTYYYTDAAGRELSAKAIITVVDSKATIDGHDSEIKVGSTWNSQDNFDGATDVNGQAVDFSQVKVEGSVDTTKVGEYEITYSYTDAVGNVVSKKVTVHVVAETDITNPGIIPEGTVKPDITNPGIIPEGTVKPDITNPGIIPEGTVKPDITNPGIIPEGTVKPDITNPGIIPEGTVKPDITNPGIIPEGTVKPDITNPGIIPEGTVKPDITNPGIIPEGTVKPDITNPGIIPEGTVKPDITNPGIIPEGTVKPDITNPGIIPEGTVKPDITNPSIVPEGDTKPGENNPGNSNNGGTTNNTESNETLPQTGEEQTSIWLTILGAISVLTSQLFFFSKRKKE